MKHSFRYFLLLGALCLLHLAPVWAADVHRLTSGETYYLYHPQYASLLGTKADGTSPGLSKPGTLTDSTAYLFVAENASESGFHRLKQKSSGNYLASSTSNTYSVLLQASNTTAKSQMWNAVPGLKGRLSNHRAADQRLGCDTGKEAETYISIFYDKAEGDYARWHIFPATSEGFDASYRAYALAELQQAVTDAEPEGTQGNAPQLYRFRLNQAIEAARKAIEHPEDSTTDRLLAQAQHVRNRLVLAAGYSANTLLGSEMSELGSEFSLALTGVQFASPEKSADMVLRTKNGQGVVLRLSEGVFEANGQRYTLGEADASLGMDYLFIYRGQNVEVYAQNQLVASIPTWAVAEHSGRGLSAEWTLMRPVNLKSYSAEIVSSNKATTDREEETDKYGNKVRRAIALANQTLKLDSPVDFHLTNETTPLTNTTIDLADEKAWVIFDNTLPSEVISKFLSSFKVNGQAASLNSNIRVGIYLNGAVVMPYSPSVKPFTGYSGEAYSGEAVSIGLGANDLGKNSNLFRSFILKRGYMATVASGTGGGGYSRVYVADHHDLLIPVLPDALNRRISSVHVKKWQYVSKKGWCSTTSNSAIATECRKVRATWFYTWSADRSSTNDTEFIPIRQHLYWPSMSQIIGHKDATHVLSFNEPEHGEQHTSDKCSCGGVISEWTSCTKTPDFQATGMRIGSPAPTDAGWLTNYIKHCDDMSYRCDFVVMHCYWGTNEASNARAWYNQLKTIYNNTKRPIWITEFNNGASWTNEWWPSGYSEKLEKNRKAIKEIIHMLDTCSFVERYAIYNWDSYYRAMINTDDGSLLPAGREYRDNKSTFAYNADVQFVPIWWAPGVKDVTLRAKLNADAGQVTFEVENPNGDVTDQLVIERRTADGSFVPYYTETDRSKFDGTKYTYTLSTAELDIENSAFRVSVTTTTNKSTVSNTASLGYIQNPGINTTTKNSVEGWTCTRSAANGFTKATGDTYLEVWDATAANINFDYHQVVSDLPEGMYELSAACFNTVDNVVGATVNGHMGLYAQADGLEYFAPVTTDGQIDPARRQTISYIAVTGGTLRLGIKNIGPMSARWAGADDFKLRFVGTLDEVLTESLETFRAEVRAASDARYRALMTPVSDEEADASALLLNPDCNRTDSYGWTVSEIEYSTGEAYDGVSGNPYWNKWSASAYTSTMEQTLAHLPAGDYTLHALMRASGGAALTLYAQTETADGTVEDYEQTFQGTGVTVPAGSPYPKGWAKVSLPVIRIQAGTQLRLGFRAVDADGGDWWSVDHFGLTFEELPVGVTEVETGNKAFAVAGGRGILTVSTPSATHLQVFRTDGTCVVNRQVEAGITRLRLPKGLYVVRGRKVTVQ